MLPASAPAITGEEDMDIEEGEVNVPPPPPGGAAAANMSSSSGWQQYDNGQQQQQGYVQYGGQDYDAYYGQHQQQQGYGGQYAEYHQVSDSCEGGRIGVLAAVQEMRSWV